MTSKSTSSDEARPPRPFRALILTSQHCAVLRETIRPLQPGREEFCVRLYGVMHALETDPDVTWYAFPVSQVDILLINHHLSEADGDEAIDLLKQTRGALYELLSGDESVILADSVAMIALFDIEVRPLTWMYEKEPDSDPEDVAPAF